MSVVSNNYYEGFITMGYTFIHSFVLILEGITLA